MKTYLYILFLWIIKSLKFVIFTFPLFSLDFFYNHAALISFGLWLLIRWISNKQHKEQRAPIFSYLVLGAAYCWFSVSAATLDARHLETNKKFFHSSKINQFLNHNQILFMEFVALFNIFDNLERIYHNAFDAEQNLYEKVFLNFHLCQNMLDSIYIFN